MEGLRGLLAGSLGDCLVSDRSKRPPFYSWDRGETEIDEGISHVRHFHQHVMHELILFISYPKNISNKCVMFRNVIVQCTVTNSFKQDRASPASV